MFRKLLIFITWTVTQCTWIPEYFLKAINDAHAPSLFTNVSNKQTHEADGTKTFSRDNREVPPDVFFGLYELTLRLWKNAANSAGKCIRRLRLWVCTHVEYGWVASVDLLQVSLGRRRCIRIRIRFVSREVKRTYETRRVSFRWRVRERVWCWSQTDQVGPLVQTSPRPLTRTPDRVRSGTKTPSRMPNRVRSGTKRPQNILTSASTGAGWIFDDFLSFDFLTVLRVSLFFFLDHADCGSCFLLAKNRIVIVTRHSASESSD